MVCLQVKLCDPHLSALEVRFSRRGAIQIYVYLYRMKQRVCVCGACRIVGFDDIGNTDDFQTSVMERRLQSSGKIDASLYHHCRVC